MIPLPQDNFITVHVKYPKTITDITPISHPPPIPLALTVPVFSDEQVQDAGGRRHKGRTPNA